MNNIKRLQSQISTICNCPINLSAAGDRAYSLSAPGEVDLQPAIRFLASKGIEELFLDFNGEETTCYLKVKA